MPGDISNRRRSERLMQVEEPASAPSSSQPTRQSLERDCKKRAASYIEENDETDFSDSEYERQQPRKRARSSIHHYSSLSPEIEHRFASYYEERSEQTQVEETIMPSEADRARDDIRAIIEDCMDIDEDYGPDSKEKLVGGLTNSDVLCVAADMMMRSKGMKPRSQSLDSWTADDLNSTDLNISEKMRLAVYHRIKLREVSDKYRMRMVQNLDDESVTDMCVEHHYNSAIRQVKRAEETKRRQELPGALPAPSPVGTANGTLVSFLQWLSTRLNSA